MPARTGNGGARPCRDYTNLAWPGGPRSGADQRPIAHAAGLGWPRFAIDWSRPTFRRAKRALPVAATAGRPGRPQARHRRTRPKKEGSHDSDGHAVDRGSAPPRPWSSSSECYRYCWRVLDRALTRARRHAAIVAGPQLATDLRHADGPVGGAAARLRPAS
jgi:hypothetical protein